MPALRPYLLLTALCLAIYLPGQRALPITDRDEARFMQATRQMLASDDWIVVRFQDQLRAKKPAGIYWLQAASVATFSKPSSNDAWPYRLPSLLAAVATVLITFAFADAVFNRGTAYIAAVTLATSLLMGVEAHLATTDAALAAFTAIAEACLGFMYVKARQNDLIPRWIWAPFWIALSATVLIKGPVAAMICAATIAALCIADRDVQWLRPLKPLWGAAICVAIVAPWLFAVDRATDGVFLFRAVHEDLLPKLAGGHEGHGAPPGYYVLMVAFSMWPASFVLWPSVARALRIRTEPALRFVLAWALPAWLIFELIPTKLPHYTLPLHPAIAILIASAIASPLANSSHTWMSKGWMLFCSLASMIIAATALWLAVKFGPGLSIAALVVSVAAITSIVCAWWPVRTSRDLQLTAGAAAGAIAQTVLIAAVLPSLSRIWISERVAQSVGQLDDELVAVAGYYEPSLVFLMNGRTQAVDGATAAKQIASTQVKIAIVEERQLPTFLKALSPRVAIERDVVDGFNYSQGKRVRLHIFEAQR